MSENPYVKPNSPSISILPVRNGVNDGPMVAMSGICRSQQHFKYIAQTNGKGIKLTENPGTVICASGILNFWLLDKESTVSSSSSAFSPEVAALKKPCLIKLSALDGAVVELLIVNSPSVISTVPLIEQVLQDTVRDSLTDPFLRNYVLVPNKPSF